MSDIANDAPPLPAGRDSRLRFYLGAALAVVCVAAGILWWPRPRAVAPVPPAVVVDEAQPELALALVRARQAVETHPGSSQEWGRLGVLLLAHDFRNEALVCFAQAEKLAPGEPRWPYHQAVELLVTDPDRGLACLERAVATGTPVSAPRLLLGEVLLGRGRLEDAETQFRHVLEAEPKNARAHHGLGRTAYARGDLAASLKHLEAAVREAPWALATHALLAEIHFRLGDAKAADQERRAVDRLRVDTPWPDPFLEEVAQARTGADAQVALAQQLLRQGRAGQAVELLQDTVARHPESSATWMALGKIFLRLDPPEYPVAERAFREAARLRPDDPAALFHLGIALERQDQVAAAADCYARAIDRKPDYAFAHYNRGQCLKRQGDRAGALQAFQSAVRYKPDFAEGHRELAELLAATGHQDDALDESRKAVQLNPGDAQAQRFLEDLEKRSNVRK